MTTSVPIPTAGGRRCRTCGRAVTGPAAVCFCCRTVAGQLGLPLVPLVASTEYRVGDAVHRRLRAYKDAREADVRDHCRRQLVAGLTGWLDDRGAALAGQLGEWAVVTAVPSSWRPGPPPVESVVDGVPLLAARHLRLLVRGRAVAGHLQAARSAFVTAPGVDRAGLSDLPVLVVDDTTTTGAAAQSAAAALRLAGAQVVGVLVLGRALPPDLTVDDVA